MNAAGTSGASLAKVAARSARPTTPKAAQPFLVFFLAARMLREHPVSLAMLVLAIAAGVAFQIPNVANLAGYRAELMDQQIASGLGHVRVRPVRDDRFHDARQVMENARTLPGVVEVQPLLSLPGSVQSKGRLLVVSVLGVNPNAGRHPYEVVEGQGLSDADEDGIILGTSVATDLGVGVGDVVTCRMMLTTRPRLLLDDDGMGQYDMTVRGLVGFAGTTRVFVNYRFIADELGEDDPASTVLVHAADDRVETARTLARQIEVSTANAVAKSWLEDGRLIRSSVGAIEAISSITDLMGLFAVGVPVLALLYIDALHRSRQVALLSAIGFNSRDVFVVFLCKAVLVGVLGIALGIALGYGLLIYFQAHPIYDYDRFVIRPVINPRFLFLPALQVLITTLLAGSYPAWRAARTQPSAMLRRLE